MIGGGDIGRPIGNASIQIEVHDNTKCMSQACDAEHRIIPGQSETREIPSPLPAKWYPCFAQRPAPNGWKTQLLTVAHCSVSLPLPCVHPRPSASNPPQGFASCPIAPFDFRFFSRTIRGFDGVEYSDVDRHHCIYVVGVVERCRPAISRCPE